MSKYFHVSMSISGALKERGLGNLITGSEGERLSHKEARSALKALQAKGQKVIPMTGCEGFCPINGCPGHEETEDAA